MTKEFVKPKYKYVIHKTIKEKRKTQLFWPTATES